MYIPGFLRTDKVLVGDEPTFHEAHISVDKDRTQLATVVEW